MDRNEILEQSVEYFRKTFSKNGKFKINKEIIRRIEQLQNAFEMEQEEIFQAMFDYFIERKLYEKYKTENALSTFVTHCVKYGLCDLKKLKIREFDRKERSLESMLNDKLCGDGASSFSINEERGLPGLANFNTPEQLVLLKELRELIFNHFGTTDALVLLDYEDLETTAKSLGMSYEAYRKRLQRKKKSFKTFLEKSGYDWH